MIAFVIGGLITIGILIVVCRGFIHSDGFNVLDAFGITFVLSLLIVPAMFGLSCWGAALTTGLAPHYSSGVIEGFLVDSSEEGLIWKTNEYKIQVGVGKQVTVDSKGLTGFSVTDIGVLEYGMVDRLKALKGKHIRVYYRGWMIMPYSLGSSNLMAIGVEEVDGGCSLRAEQ